MKTMTKWVLSSALALGSLGISTTAMAAACTGAGADGATTADFKYRGDDATQCRVVFGNDSEANVAGFFGLTGWEQIVKYEAGDADGEVAGSLAVTGGTIDLVLAYLGQDLDGWFNYSLNATGSPASLLPATMDLMGVVKQSTEFAAFLFSPAEIDAGGNLGSFRTKFDLNRRGMEINDYSHFAFYATNVTPCTGGDCGGGETGVPEPASLALVGLALLGAAAAGRRRRG